MGSCGWENSRELSTAGIAAIFSENVTTPSQEDEAVIASIGGFERESASERSVAMAIGAISQLEHALSGFKNDQENFRRRLADARKRLASYQSRVGE